MKTKVGFIIGGLTFLIGLILAGLFVRYYGDWLWFQEMDYGSVFITILYTKVLVFLIFFAIFAVFAWVNIAIARKFGYSTRSSGLVNLNQSIQSLGFPLKDTYLKYAWGIIILSLALVMGYSAVGSWETFLKFIHASSFGIADPIFSKDTGFYVFKLPLYNFLQTWYSYILILIFMGVGLSYFLDAAISIKDNRFHIHPKAKYHLTILVALFFLGIAWSYRLKLYSLLYSTRGAAYGAGYADVHAQIAAYWILIALTLIVTSTLFFEPLIKKWKWIYYAVGLYFAVLIGLVWIYPNIVEEYMVKPNELVKETPYIKNNIDFTRFAYGLTNVTEKKFQVLQDIKYSDIKKNRNTIENIRLWDSRPLIQTYKQLQEIRLYYDFKSVNVDRYHFKRYSEVALAVRELPVSQIPSRARTWINTHLIYTHGFGLVMSPVNEVTPDGMPRFIIKNIPPQASVPLTIKYPQIYYGEETDQYVIVHTKTKEFDYPKGEQNVYSNYQGRGGVRISNLFRRLIYAWNFSDIKILLTDYITNKSRIMFHRNITERDRTIAPFLSYDSDPYPVVGRDGTIYWIHDAYTTSNMYPYSKPLSQSLRGRSLNYIRNSVKVVINAYNGDVTYYVIDPSDPVIQTYQDIFPGLFKPIKDMPDFLKKHIRYPSDLFLVQTEIYNTYHMTDPKVFYNREDLWSMPTEIYQESEQSMLPYYIITKLDDSTSEEFILMLPLTPSKKNNMVAWMAARSDAPHYGELVVYRLPKEKLIYGPMQIEARINQKPDISSKLTLWGQKGSRVIRGNMLVIPIEHSFIYVEPVYLQSEQSQMPELKRVIVAFRDRLEMQLNLDEALRSVFLAEKVSPVETEKALRGALVSPSSDRAQQALYHYNKAMEYLKQADWNGYGKELNQLKRILESMAKKK